MNKIIVTNRIIELILTRKKIWRDYWLLFKYLP